MPSSTAATDWGAYWYNGLTLWVYDALVLRFNMAYVWRSPVETVLLPLFAEAFLPSKRHLDIGVATGWFPSVAVSQQQQQQQEITLMDLNPRSLRTAKRRIQHDNPMAAVAIRTIEADALGGVPPCLESASFDSVSLFNLLHCLPGPQDRKNRVFGLAAHVLADDGVLVGSTVLGYPYHGWNPLAWLMMALMNALGGFGNARDNVGIFERGLRDEFDEVTTWVVGSMLLFRATRPTRRRHART